MDVASNFPCDVHVSALTRDVCESGTTSSPNVTYTTTSEAGPSDIGDGPAKLAPPLNRRKL
jgi:hypothetical protein